MRAKSVNKAQRVKARGGVATRRRSHQNFEFRATLCFLCRPGAMLRAFFRFSLQPRSTGECPSVSR